jgi:omega-6 fatty acid desaturase (delta-12 desaturase)
MQTDAEKDLLRRISAFSTPSNRVAFFELGVTLVLFLTLCALMIYGLGFDYNWPTFLFLPFAAALVTRIFTIQHDCGHGSYFASQRINNTIGCLLGVLTHTPYYYWRKNHTVHHAFSGNLDKRGIGDIDTLTVKEYQALPPLKKAWYTIYRNPVFMLVISPLLLFGIKHKLPLDFPFHSIKSWVNIILTNLGIALSVIAVFYFFGAETFFFVYLPVLWAGSALGVAIFYIQHQYEDAYWHAGNKWTYFDAGMHGSAYFEFPLFFSWMINHINLHHIHHLNGQVPSYRLRECLSNIPELQAVPKRTFANVPGCFKVALWDDENKKMVGFG